MILCYNVVQLESKLKDGGSAMAEDLTPGEVAAELGLNRETVYRLLRNGTLPGYKAGLRQWRTLREELEAYKRAGHNRGPGRPRMNAR